MIFTEFAPDTGRITMQWTFPDQTVAELNRSSEREFIHGNFDSSIHYILNGQPTERPASPVNLSDLTLLDVPAGSTLTINGESYEGEGDVELEFPLPGVYTLRVECWPYKDWEGEVVV